MLIGFVQGLPVGVTAKIHGGDEVAADSDTAVLGRHFPSKNITRAFLRSGGSNPKIIMKAIILRRILCVALALGLSTTANAQAATNVYAQAVLADNPVVYYEFDENSGAMVAVDSSGNGNTGFYDNVSLGNAGATPVLGGAAGFNGSNSFVAVPPLGSAVSLGGHGNDRFTIECWINPQLATGASIYSYDGWENGALNYLWDWNGAGIQFSMDGNVTGGAIVFDSNPPIPVGQWTYLAAVYDDAASNVVVYVNGQVTGANAFTTAVPVDFEPAEIGSWSSGGRFFDGLIEDFAIYTNALPAERIQAHYATAAGPFVAITSQPQDAVALVGGNAAFTTAAMVVEATESPSYQWQTNGVDIPGATNASYTTSALTLADSGMRVLCVVTAPGTISAITRVALLAISPYGFYSSAVLASHPVVYYQFDESPGATVALDSSGKGKNGAYTNVFLGNPGAKPGLGYAAGFNGSNSLVTVPALGDADSLGGNGNNQFTIECWIDPQSATGAAIYANNWQLGALNYLWDWTGPGIQFSLNGNATGGTTVFDSNPTIPVGQWTYVTTVYNDNNTASNVVVYVNGQAVGTNVFTTAVPVDFELGQIGAQTGAGGRFFYGLMDDFAIYTNALSAADIQAHYAAALLPPPPPTLSVGKSGDQIALSWNASGFILQESTNLMNLAGWVNVPAGTNSPVTVPTENTSMFYRLTSQ